MNRAGSRQDYETPADFMAAVARRFAPVQFDLAASAENAKAKEFYTISDDSLAQE